MAEYSVLMSVYAKENPEYLRESIESIWNQTVKTNDFWVVCDGTLTKELDAVLEENQKAHKEVFHLLRLKENVGLGRALNEGLKCCKNEAVARMDSDDIACKDRCEKQLRVLEEGIDIVSGTVVEFEKDILHCKAKRTLPLSKEEILKFAGRRNPFNHPCVMYRKEAVEKAGGYQHFSCSAGRKYCGQVIIRIFQDLRIIISGRECCFWELRREIFRIPFFTCVLEQECTNEEVAGNM